ncbi:MAG: hypothetical protein WCO99_00030 [Planctomycetota bacterium]
MTQITVRNIPVAVEAKLRSLAHQSGTSLNQTVIRLLEAATGIKRQARRRRDFAQFASRWTAAEADAFDRAMSQSESIDEEVWR